MNLETKRNALMNSVASSGGGIELVEDITLEEDLNTVQISVDSSIYNTFIVSIDGTYSSQNNDWLYYRLNTTSSQYVGVQGGVVQLPKLTGTTHTAPIIWSRNKNDKATLIRGDCPELNILWSDVSVIRLNMYTGTIKMEVGTNIKVYGMKQSVITGE